MSDGTYSLFSPDVLTIGRLIHELRMEQGISQIVLCQGLCSKSKLSKIENDFLQPDIFLTEALFQRLGISERIFTFFGNSHYSQLYELRFKMIHDQYNSNNDRLKILHTFEQLLTKDDIIPRQFYLFSLAILETNPVKCINLLYDALHYTLPNFDITYIYKYRLSWNELTILNNIAHQYRLTSTPFIGSQILQKILEYNNHCDIDIILQKNIFSLSLYMLCRNLYTQKRFSELSILLSVDNFRLLKFSFSIYSLFLFYYCQGLAECSIFNDAYKYAIYTCAINNFLELPLNADALKSYFKNDFSIDIT